MIRQATLDDLRAAAAMAMRLWPGMSLEERADDLRPLFENPEAAVFLAWKDGTPVGYAQCQLRHDYVEGCEESPVGYLEGLYVEPECRGTGLAARLLDSCQEWSKQQGCTEFASDCELDNEMSLRFHLKNGFEEAGRIICFVKKL